MYGAQTVFFREACCQVLTSVVNHENQALRAALRDSFEGPLVDCYPTEFCFRHFFFGELGQNVYGAHLAQIVFFMRPSAK